ncbi:MAG: FAD-dependent monooxygenase [Acidobacteriia bacterium]|nr:FAD-dependent monooxygenase [Terriglobia bacterium]
MLPNEGESQRDKQTQVSVIGGGPAGSAAAISALSVGARVRLFEPSTLPRHKVCGEFLSPEIAPLLDRLGLWQSVLDARPSRIAAIQLHFHNRTRKDILPEAAFGLSRFQFDRILMEGALAQGAELERARGPAQPFTTPTVLAHGRRHAASHPSRLFGFKAHFHGPVDDSTDLFFFPGGYCGVNTVENEITNVCGLASWRVLSRCGFHYDELVHSFPPLARRLAPLTRAMDWLSAGPLVFENRLRAEFGPCVFPAGDALSFVDPFTGTGMTYAVFTGASAGRGATLDPSPVQHLLRCRRALARPTRFSALFREVLLSGWGEKLSPLAPVSWLYRATRPIVCD